jgi:cytochrome P450
MPLFDDLKARLHQAEAVGEAAVEHALSDAQGDVMAFLDRLKAHTAQNPEPLFAVLRRVKPILIVKNVALVTRFEDVQEVLARDDIFQVTYGTKMRVITGGQDFFLGMQNSPDYERDVAHMRSVMRRQDIAAISGFVAKAAEQIVSQSGGKLELVNQLSRVVPARWIAEYFGTVPPSDRELADWGSTIFQYLFTDLTNDPAVGRAAQDAAAKARQWLDDCIAQRKASGEQKDDVLGRCLALQSIDAPGMDDLGIRNNLIGLITGAIPTTSKCCAQALDQLLDRPEVLAQAHAAAAAGNSALFAAYVFEALRFNPNNPGVFRLAAEDYIVAKGTLRATTIPKGTSVLPATQSAMFDEHKVDSPNEFRVDRPAWVYMHWGYALHTCSGQYINQVQIPAILQPLVARKNLRRAAGDAGKLQLTGPFPSSLNVTFDA